MGSGRGNVALQCPGDYDERSGRGNPACADPVGNQVGLPELALRIRDGAYGTSRSPDRGVASPRLRQRGQRSCESFKPQAEGSTLTRFPPRESSLIEADSLRELLLILIIHALSLADAVPAGEICKKPLPHWNAFITAYFFTVR